MSDLDRYLQPPPALSARAWLLPFVLAAGATGLIIASVAESDKLTVLQSRNEALQAARAVPPAPKPRPADVELQKRWAELLLERDYPWAKVFAAVERADQSSIELLEFKPDKRNHRIVLRGEARDADALTAYLEALESDITLSKVYLAHRQLVAHNGLNTVSFEIKASFGD